MSIWTYFYDMHSGGDTKVEPYEMILIEAPKKEAISVFYSRFGRNPLRVTCTCCGEDYSIEAGELTRITGYYRNCAYEPTGEVKETPWGMKDVYEYVEKQNNTWKAWCEPGTSSPPEGGRYLTIEEYFAREDVLAIPAKDIKDEERKADVPEEGYVWVAE